jgi:hypothetical protein
MRERDTFRCLAVAASAAAFVGCVDPVHDQQVEALGGEAPGVPTGPDHRPGQPCLVCHGGQGPASTDFSVAGTVYAVEQQSAPAVGAQVQVEDMAGSVFVSPTNAAGNFYVTTSQWQPTFPIKMQVSLGPVTTGMMTAAGRDGSCAACHQSTVGPASPGPVYVATDPNQLLGDGGTGP